MFSLSLSMKNKEDIFFYAVVTLGVLVISLWVAEIMLNLFVYLIK